MSIDDTWVCLFHEGMIDEIIEIATVAGDEILKFYGRDSAVESKADDSPLTLADKASHDWIATRLRSLTPEIPVISEEADLPVHAMRKSWKTFWLVDPLDGTKEFLKQTGEFTVNIGLIENGIPSVGVVLAPAIGLSYWTDGSRAWKKESGGAPRTISAGTFLLGSDPVLVASRDHAGPAVAELARKYPNADFRSMGSSLKFCLVAEGVADLYLRDVPTMEWDTAAAHAVLLAAGASLQCLDGTSLQYNKPDLHNAAIVAFRPGAVDLLQQ